MATLFRKSGRHVGNSRSNFPRTIATIAFDMYGTVFNVNGLTKDLRNIPSIGIQKEPAFNAMWRSKQLEYTFRRTCMNKYAPMSECTLHALDYCCKMFDAPLTSDEKKNLCDKYTQLPTYEDCKQGLNLLHMSGYRIFAFSNGTRNDISSLLKNAELVALFHDIVVVDDMKNPVFKPHPNIYQYFIDRSNSDPENTWLVSSNPFDIMGAAACGWKTAWMQRTKDIVFDPWPNFEGPTITISSLIDLKSRLKMTEKNFD